jgi:hypothetical protein
MVFGERRRSLSGRVHRVREGRGGSTEGASERGKWASGARGSKGARTCGGGRRTRGRGRVRGEGRGREVGDGLTGGVHGTKRERVREREERHRQIGPTEQREREREGERARGLAPTGGTRLSGTESARAWGWA